jgi:DNA replication and repair protein RecF
VDIKYREKVVKNRNKRAHLFHPLMSKKIEKNSKEVLEATNNFNFLVEKVNNSIKYSTKSIEHSCESIELIEKNIEEFLELFSGTKAGRLRFFDRFLVQVYPKYREILARATKSHKQKTALLRASFEYEKTYLEAQLTIWNNILIETIPQIIKIREEFLTAINPIIQAELSKILASSDTISFKLQKAEDINSTEESVKNWLAQNKSREILSQKNYISPSRDDFQCFFREKNILQTASRGETRAILLALLSAKKRWLQENFKINPILLLDDVFSELDAQRQNQLENICKNSQVFFTTTHKSHFAKFSQNIQTFEIK